MKLKHLTESERKAHINKINKECKKRYGEKKHQNAPMIDCGCGCGEKIKSIDITGRPKKFMHGHSGRKYKDPREYKRVYDRKIYKDPKLKHIKDRKLKAKKKYHHIKKSKLIILKGGKCTKCNLEYNGKNGCVFQFHHTDPSNKLDKVTFWWSWEKILKEAEKCELVCANCHFKIHGDEF